MIYFGRNKYSYQKYNLFFALFTISLLGYLINGSYVGQYIYRTYDPLNYYLSITEAVFVFFIGYFFISYLSNFFYFTEKTNKQIRILIVLLGLVLSLTITAPIMKGSWYVEKLFTPVVIAVGIIQTILFYITLKYIFANKLYHNKESRVILVGLVLILFNLLVTKIILSFDSNNLFARNNFFTGTAVLLFAYALSIRFNNEFKDLVTLKNNLEKLVEERTFELASANKQIQESSEHRTSFFINLAHETKTPLMLIRNYLDRYIAQKGIDNDLLVVRNNFDRLYNGMIDYLDKEKLISGKQSFNNYTVIDISEIVNEKLDLFRKVAQLNDIEILDFIESKVQILTDITGFGQIVNNLIDNAIKNTPAGRKIKIALYQRNGDVVFKVTDKGNGIPHEQLDHIFKPFYQVENEKKNIPGFGLGLSIVKDITGQMNGIIRVLSKVGLGSMFEIRFKKINGNTVSELTPNSAAAIITPDIIPNGKSDTLSSCKRIILLVEDNLSMLDFIQNELQTTYNVFIATNGREALNILGNNIFPDLIITDVMMDIMDGNDLFNYLQNHPVYSSIPIIFMTAKSIKEERHEMLQKGASDYIFKPFTVDELKARISSVLQNRRKSRNEGLREAIGLLEKQIEAEISPVSKRGAPDIYSRCKELDLTERQIEIIILLSKGNSYKQIANELNISDKTVTRHVQNLFEKFGLHNKVELINLINN